MKPLFNFQVQALEFLLTTKRGLLALDCGLGKTRVCIELAKELKRELHVVAPAFLKKNWLNELEKWGYEYDAQIVSYEKAKSIKPKDRAVLVVDESHYCRNWTARRTREVCQGLALKHSRVIFSTATPIVNSAADMHPSLSVIQPGKWGKFSDYRERYCYKKEDKFKPGGYRYFGVKEETEEELKRRMRKIIFTRHKKDVMHELPDKTVIDVEIEIHLDALSFAQNDKVNRDVLLGIQTEEVKSEQRRIGLEKVPYVVEHCQNIGAATPFVVFAWHKDVVMSIAAELGCPFITGETSMVARNDLIDKFQSGEIDQLVVSIGACGVGVNLHRASVGVFAEIPWTAAELKQCEDRLHRIGQENKVTIYRMIALNTIDEAILRNVTMKRDASEAIGVKL